MRTYTFFLKIWRWKSAKIGFVESDTECLGEFQLREKVNSHKSSRENWKAFEKLTLKRKTCFFQYRGESPTSRQGKPPKHSKSKLWKKFLSDFCGWKVYLWESHELSCENLSVSLVTGPFTRKQVVKTNSRARGCSIRLGWFATESPK